MTSFHLFPGYAQSERQKCSISDILSVVKSISLLRLREKGLEYGVSESCIDEYVKSYSRIPSDDLTIYEEGEQVVQLASGGYPSRDTKEQMRKALAILVLDECYKRGWSVSFEIA